MAIIDPYSTLGVSKSATQEEIKTAYRELAKKYHPDLNPGNQQAEAKFKDIASAYDQIGTQEQRAKYDRGEAPIDTDERFNRRRPFYYETQNAPGGGRYTSGFSSFSNEGEDDIFKYFFQDARGQDLHYSLEIDLKDAVMGTQKEIDLPHGNRLSIKIPPGVISGSKLRFSGQGGQGKDGGRPGDAFVEIKIRPSKVFHQQGDDLILDLPISLSEAIFGGEIAVPTIDGSVKLKVPPKVNTDTKLRLSGQGVYNRKTKQRGDQIIRLKVRLPTEIDSDLENAIKNWSKSRPYNPRDQPYEKQTA